MIEVYNLLNQWIENNPAKSWTYFIIIIVVLTEINYFIFLSLQKKEKNKECWLNVKLYSIIFAIAELGGFVFITMCFQYWMQFLIGLGVLLLLIAWLWINKIISRVVWDKSYQKKTIRRKTHRRRVKR